VDGIIFKILKLSPLPKLGSFYLVSSIWDYSQNCLI
jgi:hypothetical protein